MLWTLMLNLAAFTLVYAYLLVRRYQVAVAEEALAALEAEG